MTAIPPVIIIGGGPTGLTAALAFSQAKIPFTLLEARSQVIIDAGSDLVLQPMAIRALSQLGILDDLVSSTSELLSLARFDNHGGDLGELKFLETQKAIYGRNSRITTRKNILRLLHDGIPEDVRKTSILTNKKVADITKTEQGVSVTCTDGVIHHGSLVIGADGAHSKTRQYMRSLALAAGATAKQVNPEQPFETTFRCLWIRFPLGSMIDMEKTLRPGAAFETHSQGAGTQLFIDQDTAVSGVYENVSALTSPEERELKRRYEAGDEEAFVKRWGHLTLIPGTEVTIADAWRERLDAGLVNLEEGVAEHWSWDGRIALVGDAAHKFTPSTGLGCNNGIIDVVALANELQDLLCDGSISLTSSASEDAEKTMLSEDERQKLAQALGRYQVTRQAAVTAGCKQSGNATAMATWKTTVHKVLDRWVFSMGFVTRYLGNKAAFVQERDTPIFRYAAAPA